MTGSAVTHAVRTNHDLFGIPHWTPHDLRRTAASGLARAGVSRTVIGKVLNHAEPGVTAVYDRHGYDAEKRAALDAWGEKIGQILRGEGGKVVPMVK